MPHSQWTESTSRFGHEYFGPTNTFRDDYLNKIFEEFSAIARSCIISDQWKDYDKKCLHQFISNEKAYKRISRGGTQTVDANKAQIPKVLHSQSLQRLMAKGDLKRVFEKIEQFKKQGQLPKGTKVVPFIGTDVQNDFHRDRLLMLVP